MLDSLLGNENAEMRNTVFKGQKVTPDGGDDSEEDQRSLQSK